jgi:hypothetical protein
MSIQVILPLADFQDFLVTVPELRQIGWPGWIICLIPVFCDVNLFMGVLLALLPAAALPFIAWIVLVVIIAPRGPIRHSTFRRY